MKITLIMPSVGRKQGDQRGYLKSWLMEPLAMAVLASLTPPEIQKVFYDDRLEAIPFDEPTDLVAINVETYTARRAYQIAAEFQRRGRLVVMGGFHPTLVPEEVEQYADSVLLGEAEGLWPELLRDAASGCLKKRYQSPCRPELGNVIPEREIYQRYRKRYLPVTLIETGRGCKFKCEFCSVTAFFEHDYRPRPVETIIADIRRSNAKRIFFVDDNFSAVPERAEALCEALIPLGIQWFSQVSMNISHNERLLKLMKRSGCMGVLIGFENMRPAVLKQMGKTMNSPEAGYQDVVAPFHRHGLAIYASFVFGYDDDEESLRLAYRFCVEQKIFYAAFNHLMPFPGTPLYQRLHAEHRLAYANWWLAADYRFGKLAFLPRALTPEALSDLCYQYRYRFFSVGSIWRRLWHARLYGFNPLLFGAFLLMNLTGKSENSKRRDLPLGWAEGPGVRS
jgi:radical SAM superfamily enzyme YgiQ (UPF0313 family)